VRLAKAIPSQISAHRGNGEQDGGLEDGDAFVAVRRVLPEQDGLGQSKRPASSYDGITNAVGHVVEGLELHLLAHTVKDNYGDGGPGTWLFFLQINRR
jgi:hypothetical protein